MVQRKTIGFCLLILKPASLLNLLLVLLINLNLLYFSGDNIGTKKCHFFLSCSFHSLYWSDLPCQLEPGGLCCRVVVLACIFFLLLRAMCQKESFDRRSHQDKELPSLHSPDFYHRQVLTLSKYFSLKSISCPCNFYPSVRELRERGKLHRLMLWCWITFEFWDKLFIILYFKSIIGFDT